MPQSGTDFQAFGNSDATAAPAVLVVGYRDADSVVAAVASVLAGSLQPAWIGVVDHSPAGVPVPAVPAGVVLVRDAGNPGFAAGVNRLAGLAPPAADLFLLNPDARVGEDTLRLLAEFMAAQPQLAAGAVPIDHDPERERPWFTGARVQPWCADVRHRTRPARPLEPTDFLTGCAMWVRRTAWEQIGALDESLFLYGEDLDWSLRARKRGWQLAVAGATARSARVRHRVSASVGQLARGDQLKTYLIARNTVRVLFRHYGRWRVLPLGLPRLLFAGLRVRERRAWFAGLRAGLAGETGKPTWA